MVRAAMALASEGGYEAVQMRDVAAHAHVALGTVYRYFSSKDHLLVATLEQWADELRQRLAQRPPRGETPADRVVDVLRRATRALERVPPLTSALVTAVSSLSADDHEALESARSVYGILTEIITDAMRDGEPAERDSIIRVIGQVWFSTLVARVRGWAERGEMSRDLEAAVRVLLPHAQPARGRTMQRGTAASGVNRRPTWTASS